MPGGELIKPSCAWWPALTASFKISVLGVTIYYTSALWDISTEYIQ